MREVRRTIHIDATPDAVWDALTDFAAYPEWSTFIRSIEGHAAEGERLRVQVQPVGGDPMSFRPTVLRADEGQELRWLGRVLLPRIFDGEHRFILTRDGDGTRLEHGEVFRGILVKPMWKSLEGGTVAGFENFNRELKQRVESR